MYPYLKVPNEHCTRFGLCVLKAYASKCQSIPSIDPQLTFDCHLGRQSFDSHLIFD